MSIDLSCHHSNTFWCHKILILGKLCFMWICLIMFFCHSRNSFPIIVSWNYHTILMFFTSCRSSEMTTKKKTENCIKLNRIFKPKVCFLPRILKTTFLFITNFLTGKTNDWVNIGCIFFMHISGKFKDSKFRGLNSRPTRPAQ